MTDLAPSGPRRPRRPSALELVVLIAVTAGLLAAGVPAFVRTVRTSMLAEVPHQLARIGRAAAAYYEREHPSADGPQSRCLPPTAGPVPERPSANPVDVDPQADEAIGAATWRALGFRFDAPIRFRYGLRVEPSGCGLEGRSLATAYAEGDLDGDGSLSRFERVWDGRDGRLIAAGVLHERDRTE
ncbi:MAG: hypothetical protein NZ898_03125 [Myxococcota bacterium]|nr:hypothetical protein [Myxococcota bacterium]MDW8361015.1 hypothetical protein [Myxococcales bacterium]